MMTSTSGQGLRERKKPTERLLDILRPPGKWLYRDAHYLAVEMEIDRVAAKTWVPFPLRLAKPTATMFLAWFPETSFGSIYREAGLFLHVEHLGMPSVFSPWMLVDDDVALITGRELLGYPKKMGTMTWSLDGDRISASAERRGTELVRMEGRLGERVAVSEPILGRPHRNVRTSMGFALPKVVAFTPLEERIEVRRAELDVKIGSSERDPLGDLAFGKVLSAHLYRVNLGLSGSLLRGLPLPVSAVSPMWHLRQLLFRAH